MPTFDTGRIRRPDKNHLITLSERHHKKMMQGLMEVQAPPSFDSRAQGWVGPIKAQGRCGSCWDFSGTGMVEIAYNKAGIGGGPDQFILSEEYTLSCCRNGGCNGDDNVTVLEWAKAKGLPLTKDYGPYAERPQRCAFQQSMTLYKIDDWGFCEGQGVASVESIKAAIMAYGCVGAAIAADNAFMNVRPGEVFDGRARNINHDIILVGWDDARGAWILRNSWGTEHFGDQGYCWIKYGANQVGTEAVWCRINAAAPPIDDWTP